MLKWLAPGGKVYIVADSPYSEAVKDFIPVFERRQKSGELWPGTIEDISTFNHPRQKDLPTFMNLLDPKTISRTLINCGFTVEQCSYFAQSSFPVDSQLDGREGIGAIAVKA